MLLLLQVESRFRNFSSSNFHMLLLYPRIIIILFAELLNFDYLSRKRKNPSIKILDHAVADAVGAVAAVAADAVDVVAAVIFILTILISQLNYQ